MLRIAALAVAIAHVGCTTATGDDDDDDDDDVPSAGLTMLEVPLLGGGSEPVWMYVATPAGPGPHPIVVYGHGQGAGNVVNCTPDRAPDDEDARQGTQIADDLAAEGYLTISIFYRNRGLGIPAVGEMRARDHYILDARTFLAAARWAGEHGGGASVAFVGVSMGSYPATWATAPLPELADLQDGLDIVTSIPTAMLGNHIANTGRSKDLLMTSDLDVRASTVALAGLASVTAQLALAEHPSIMLSDLDAPRFGLTSAGADLVNRAFIAAPDPSLAGCLADMPAVCSAQCFVSTFAAVRATHGLTGVTVLDWVRPETVEAITYWDPPTAVDPGPTTSNAMLAAQRALSPAYALPGSLRTARMLPLTSTGDRVVTGQLGGGNQGADLYIARLRSTGVAIPDPVPVVRDAACGHGNYLDPGRPGCGWTIVLDELATAFAQ